MTDSINNYSTKKKQSADGSHHQKRSLDSEERKIQQQKIDKKMANMPVEYGGRPKEKGLEPTRYGDWELKGRCIDF